MEKCMMPGAAVERGRISAIASSGNDTVYTVESIDRPGAVTLTIPAMGDTLNVNDVVYFSLFQDGTGIILSGIGGRIVRATATEDRNGLMSAEDKVKLDNLAAANVWSLDAGEAIPENSDLDSYTTPGNYRCESGTIASTISNCPVGSNPFVLKIMESQEPGILIQWVIQGNGVRMFLRRYANSAFSDWMRYTTDNATTDVSGYMSAGDKTKLDGIAAGAEVNQNAFSNIKVGTTTVEADAKQDTLELEAGANVALTPDATNDKVTISATDTTYSNATSSASGLMSAADKEAFDNSTVRGKGSSTETNLDNFKVSGIYWLSATQTSGWPSQEPNNHNAVLNVFFDGGGARIQELTMYSGTGENNRYVRMFINSQWYAWRKIATGAGELELGQQITANANLNNYKTPGTYASPVNITPTLTNKPPVASNAFVLKVMVGHVAGTVVQIAIDVVGTNIFVRYFNTSAWGSWYKYTGTAV